VNEPAQQTRPAESAQQTPPAEPTQQTPPAQQTLRERKKARTRASLREHALRLFREQGYQATTVEQIAAAAEVSPSTFFRYFPAKEDLILEDDMDVRMLAALERQPPELGVLAAVRAATREALASYTDAELALIGETTALTVTVPELRARALDEFARTIHVVGGAVAKRAGRQEDDLAVRTMAGAIIGVIMSVTMPWESWRAIGVPDTSHEVIKTSFKQIDKALALLEGGLPL
jgi:AcrR family transcriptional regulator